MTTGEVLRVRAAMKPIATVPRALRTVDVATGEAAVAHHQRSDVCAVPAAGIVAEAMVALVLADAVLEKFGGDSVRRDPAQRRELPRHAEVQVTGRDDRPAGRARRPDGRRQDHGRRGCSPRRWGVAARDTDADIEAARGPLDLRHLRRLRRGRTSAPSSAAAVADALAEHDGVLALGGGAVLDPGTRSAAGRPPRGLPAGRAQRRRQAGRAGQRRGRCCSATSAAGSRRCSTSAPRSTSRSPRCVVDTDGRTPEEVAGEIRGGAGMSRP